MLNWWFIHSEFQSIFLLCLFPTEVDLIGFTSISVMELRAEVVVA